MLQHSTAPAAPTSNAAITEALPIPGLPLDYAEPVCVPVPDSGTVDKLKLLQPLLHRLLVSTRLAFVNPLRGLSKRKHVVELISEPVEQREHSSAVSPISPAPSLPLPLLSNAPSTSTSVLPITVSPQPHSAVVGSPVPAGVSYAVKLFGSVSGRAGERQVVFDRSSVVFDSVCVSWLRVVICFKRRFVDRKSWMVCSLHSTSDDTKERITDVRLTYQDKAGSQEHSWTLQDSPWCEVKAKVYPYAHKWHSSLPDLQTDYSNALELSHIPEHVLLSSLADKPHMLDALPQLRVEVVVRREKKDANHSAQVKEEEERLKERLRSQQHSTSNGGFGDAFGCVSGMGFDEVGRVGIDEGWEMVNEHSLEVTELP